MPYRPIHNPNACRGKSFTTSAVQLVDAQGEEVALDGEGWPGTFEISRTITSCLLLLVRQKLLYGSLLLTILIPGLEHQHHIFQIAVLFAPL